MTVFIYNAVDLLNNSAFSPNMARAIVGRCNVASARWSRNETDFLGRTISESRPGFGGSTLVTSNLYDTAGRLFLTLSLSTRSTCSTRLNSRLFLYDELNERVATVDDRNFDGAIDWTGPDLISSNATCYVALDDSLWRETATYSIDDDDSAAPRLMGVRRSRMTGLGTDGLAAESVSIDQRGNATTNRVWRYRDNALEISETKYPTSQIAALSVVSNNLATMSVSQTGVTNTFAYDALNRQIAQTDGRGNTAQTVYDSLGRVASTIDALGHATTYGYDALGRRVSTTDPLTNTVYIAYDAEGHVVSQRGATYPADYSYDEFGDKVSMTTYRDLSGERETGNGEPVSGALEGDVTTWLRDEATGLVTNKVYADGIGPTYTYTPDGKLATRTWARGIVTTYSYDANGALTNTVYSDGTPTISLAYNRAGRQTRALDAAGVTTFAYDVFGSLTNETVRIDDDLVVVTNTIDRYYDSFGRSLGYALNGVRQSTLAYDPATGCLATMQIPEAEESNLHSPTPTQNSNFFTWSYLPGSDLKSSLAYSNGLTASWQYDANNQLLQVCNAFPTNIVSQYDYTYDAAGRRTERCHSGSAFATPDQIYYDYNARGELTNAVASIDAAYNFAYSYDDIGNRLWAIENTNETAYTANNLNQYTAIEEDAETFVPHFDADGNQTLIKTKTGVWQAIYNGENRPVYWSNGATNIVMSFDRMGRRVQYLETAGSTTNANNTFTYDNYVCIARHRSQSNGSIETDRFIWDPTEPVATRPLVFCYATEPPAYYTHDGNKNVSEVVDGAEDVVAHYEYDVFGENRVESGLIAEGNPWRFSSEYNDDTINLVYFNYRHYEKRLGCWVSRDPMSETAGRNLYSFLSNSPVSKWDRFGLLTVPTHEFFKMARMPYQISSYVQVQSEEITHYNRFGDFFSFLPFSSKELSEYYWRVKFIARFTPPSVIATYHYPGLKGQNALGGDESMYTPGDAGDLTNEGDSDDIWGMPEITGESRAKSGILLSRGFYFPNKKFRYGYFVYRSYCDKMVLIYQNEDMYSSWYQSSKKLIDQDMVATGTRSPCETIVVEYGDQGLPPSYVVFQGRAR